MELGVGAIVDGKVTGITKFGAFVALPEGKSGLVHISEIAYTYVNEVSDHLREGQEVKWPKAEQEQYHSILKRADEVVYVSRDYHPDCMLERNRYMVDRASILLAVYNGTYRSGTAMTVRYAKEQGTKIMIIDPISRVISSMGGDT